MSPRHDRQTYLVQVPREVEQEQVEALIDMDLDPLWVEVNPGDDGGEELSFASPRTWPFLCARIERCLKDNPALTWTALPLEEWSEENRLHLLKEAVASYGLLGPGIADIAGLITGEGLATGQQETAGTDPESHLHHDRHGGRDVRFRAAYRPLVGGFDPGHWPQAMEYLLEENRLEDLLANDVGEHFHARLGDGNALTATSFSFEPPETPDQQELHGEGRMCTATETPRGDYHNHADAVIHSVRVAITIGDEDERRRITAALHRQAGRQARD